MSMNATDTAKTLLPLYLVTREREGRAVWARDAIHAVEQTGWQSAMATPVQIVAVETPWGDALAIRTSEMDVFAPYASECGRFTVDPLETYGIHPSAAQLLGELNARYGFADGSVY